MHSDKTFYHIINFQIHQLLFNVEMYLLFGTMLYPCINLIMPVSDVV